MSRKSKRAALVTLLEANATFVAVYDHETKDFGGKSPVAMVHSDGTGAHHTRGVGEDNLHRFIVSLWWLRADGEATEEYMDDLSDAVLAAMKSAADAALSRLQPVAGEYSQMDYPIVDGKQYRRERIRVIA